MMVIKPRRPVFQPSHPHARGMISAWLFHEGGGNICHDLVGHLDGVMSGISWGTNKMGAMVIVPNGSNGIIRCDGGPAAQHASPQLSIVYASTSNGNGGYFYLFGPITSFETLTGGGAGATISIEHLAIGGTSTETFPVGTRYVNGITCDNVNLPRFYKDGRFAGTGPSGGPRAPTGTPQVTLLNRRTDLARDYGGTVEFLYVYNRVLSPGEMMSLALDPYPAFRPILTTRVKSPPPPGTTTIRLNWTDNAENEGGFSIERKMDAGAFGEIDTVAADVETYDDGPIDEGHTYTYRVKATSTPLGDSEYSNEAAETV